MSDMTNILLGSESYSKTWRCWKTTSGACYGGVAPDFLPDEPPKNLGELAVALNRAIEIANEEKWDPIVGFNIRLELGNDHASHIIVEYSGEGSCAELHLHPLKDDWTQTFGVLSYVYVSYPDGDENARESAEFRATAGSRRLAMEE